MKRVAVLGANGQLGKTLRALTKEEPDRYFFYSRQDIDITQKSKLEKAFRKVDYDYCINCAAFTDVEAAEKNINDAFSVNSEGARNIAEVCGSFRTSLIHISTDYVFDGKKTSPYTTQDKTNPINQYGKSKLQGEFYIKENLDNYYIIRTSWLYSIYGKNFLKTIINKISQNTELRITTEEIGTPTSTIDLSEFILHLVRNNSIPFGIYNFSAQGSTTWFGLAKEIAKCFYPEREKNITSTNEFKSLVKRPKYSVLELSKTESVYEASKEWQKSVKRVVEDYKTAEIKDQNSL